MRLKLLAAPLLIVATVLFAASVATAQDAPPGPSAGEKLAGDLLQPRGIAVGPDGFVYVAEAGTGGATEVVLPEGAGTLKTGLTGRISKIDPATGTRTTVADELPSVAFADSTEAGGPADVAFSGSTLYYLQTAGGEASGFPATPNGVYRVSAGGSTTLVADIGTWNLDNPVPRIVSGEQEDVEPGGNPYSMIVRDGVFYVADANYNQILKATADGVVSRLVDFNANIVPTGIAFKSSGGPFYVSQLGPGPFLPEDGKIVTVAPLTGDVAPFASGISMLTAVDIGPADQVYALSFATDFSPFTGQVVRANADGTLTPIVTGFSFATAMEFDANTLFVLNDGINGLGTGEVWAIENFSSVQPPAPPAPTPAAPAPTPGTGVVAPDTGTGPANGDSAPWALYGVLALVAGLAVFAAGSRLSSRHERSQ
ncbi:MAG: ScyD/ScyE family protein [Dehalococcoidia bacterium]